MARNMPASSFAAWVKYSEIEPFGFPWENWLFARDAWQFATVHSDPKKGKPKFSDYIYEAEARKRDRQNKQFFNFLDSVKPKAR